MSADPVAMRRRLDAVDFTPLQQETGASEAVLEDFKRFLALKAANKDFYAALLSPSPRVDELWHAFILDTLAYKEACESINNCKVDNGGCDQRCTHTGWPGANTAKPRLSARSTAFSSASAGAARPHCRAAAAAAAEPGRARVATGADMGG